MDSLRCEVCLGEDEKVFACPLLPPLLYKHLGVLVCGEVQSCVACSQLLQNWDTFSTEAKINLAMSHPITLHEHKVFAPSLGVGKEEFKPDPDSIATYEDIKPNHAAIDEIKEFKPELDTVPTNGMSEEPGNVATVCKMEIEESDDMTQEAPSYPQDVWEKPQVIMHEIDCSGLFSSEHESDESPLLPTVEEQADSEEQLSLVGSISPPSSPADCDINPIEQHTCPECGRNFLYEILLTNHVKYSHPTASTYLPRRQKTIPCPKCFSKFSVHQNLFTHIIDCHLEMKDDKFCCVFCTKLLSRKSSFLRHLGLMHFRNASLPKLGKFKCEECSHSFNSQHQLRSHCAQKHEDYEYRPAKRKKTCNKNHFICKICYKVLSSKASLQSHHQKLHSKLGSSISSKKDKQRKSRKLKFPCPDCSNSFPSKKSLISHSRHHFPDLQGTELTNNQIPKLKLKIVKKSGSFSCAMLTDETSTSEDIIKQSQNAQNTSSQLSPESEVESDNRIDTQISETQISETQISTCDLSNTSVNAQSSTAEVHIPVKTGPSTNTPNKISPKCNQLSIALIPPSPNHGGFDSPEYSQTPSAAPSTNSPNIENSQYSNVVSIALDLPSLHTIDMESAEYCQAPSTVAPVSSFHASDKPKHPSTSDAVPQLNSFSCHFCGKELLFKLAMQVHVQQSHINQRHHLSLDSTKSSNTHKQVRAITEIEIIELD